MTLNEALVHIQTCRSIEELYSVWQQYMPDWKRTLGPIELRRVIATKDECKLRFAQEAIRRNEGDMDIMAVLLSTIRGMFESTPLTEAWEELASSGLSDMDATDPSEAIFLFALRLVETADPETLLTVWERERPWWKRKLPVAAYRILSDTFHERLKALNLQAFREGKYGSF
ncbi:MAG: hypothetical protein LLG06_08055 [Desulfobacteraceae bacterium]|nr:hypothetical protein [Desulfobacteraceae bacterium]